MQRSHIHRSSAMQEARHAKLELAQRKRVKAARDESTFPSRRSSLLDLGEQLRSRSPLGFKLGTAHVTSSKPPERRPSVGLIARLQLDSKLRNGDSEHAILTSATRGDLALSPRALLLIPFIPRVAPPLARRRRRAAPTRTHLAFRAPRPRPFRLPRVSAKRSKSRPRAPDRNLDARRLAVWNSAERRQQSSASPSPSPERLEHAARASSSLSRPTHPCPPAVLRAQPRRPASPALAVSLSREPSPAAADPTLHATPPRLALALLPRPLDQHVGHRHRPPAQACRRLTAQARPRRQRRRRLAPPGVASSDRPRLARPLVARDLAHSPRAVRAAVEQVPRGAQARAAHARHRASVRARVPAEGRPRAPRGRRAQGRDPRGAGLLECVHFRAALTAAGGRRSWRAAR